MTTLATNRTMTNPSKNRVMIGLILGSTNFSTSVEQEDIVRGVEGWNTNDQACMRTGSREFAISRSRLILQMSIQRNWSESDCF